MDIDLLTVVENPDTVGSGGPSSLLGAQMRAPPDLATVRLSTARSNGTRQSNGDHGVRYDFFNFW
jgi:hypothetical protein